MKRIIAVTLLLVAIGSSYSLLAKKEHKKKVKKEISYEEDNGTTLLTIKTTEDGKVNEETYEGEAAKVKMKELEKEESMKAFKKKTVKKTSKNCRSTCSHKNASSNAKKEE